MSVESRALRNSRKFHPASHLRCRVRFGIRDGSGVTVFPLCNSLTESSPPFEVTIIVADRSSSDSFAATFIATLLSPSPEFWSTVIQPASPSYSETIFISQWTDDFMRMNCEPPAASTMALPISTFGAVAVFFSVSAGSQETTPKRLAQKIKASKPKCFRTLFTRLPFREQRAARLCGHPFVVLYQLITFQPVCQREQLCNPSL